VRGLRRGTLAALSLGYECFWRVEGIEELTGRGQEGKQRWRQCARWVYARQLGRSDLAFGMRRVGWMRAHIWPDWGVTAVRGLILSKRWSMGTCWVR
jgi:hypothetical protein